MRACALAAAGQSAPPIATAVMNRVNPNCDARGARDAMIGSFWFVLEGLILNANAARARHLLVSSLVSKD
jgi:hypothetical protein